MSCIWMPPHLLLSVSCWCHYKRLCTHFMHKVHFIELASTPLPHTPQGYFLESTTFWRPTPHFMTFVFPTFTLNPFASNPLFHLCSFLFKSSSESANSTKSSAYNNSQGNPLSSNLLDSASITMIKSSGLSTDPWWTPTSTGKSLPPTPFTFTDVFAFLYIDFTALMSHPSSYVYILTEVVMYIYLRK